MGFPRRKTREVEREPTLLTVDLTNDEAGVGLRNGQHVVGLLEDPEVPLPVVGHQDEPTWFGS